MKSHKSYPNVLDHMHNTLLLDKSQPLWSCLRENEPQFHNHSIHKWEQTHFHINTPPLIRPVNREDGQRRGTVIQTVLHLPLTKLDQLSFHSAVAIHTNRIIIYKSSPVVISRSPSVRRVTNAFVYSTVMKNRFQKDEIK